MSNMKLNWRKKGFEIIVYSGDKERRRDIAYTNMIDKNPQKIAQVLLDLEMVDNFPIFQAVKIYLERRDNKDWLGL